MNETGPPQLKSQTLNIMSSAVELPGATIERGVSWLIRKMQPRLPEHKGDAAGQKIRPVRGKPRRGDCTVFHRLTTDQTNQILNFHSLLLIKSTRREGAKIMNKAHFLASSFAFFG